jgi:hypothetical protein
MTGPQPTASAGDCCEQIDLCPNSSDVSCREQNERLRIVREARAAPPSVQPGSGVAGDTADRGGA